MPFGGKRNPMIFIAKVDAMSTIKYVFPFKCSVQNIFKNALFVNRRRATLNICSYLSRRSISFV